MRSIFLSIFVILIAVASLSAQGKSNEAIGSQIKSLKAEKTLAVEFNKASNITKVLAFGEDFGRDQDRANNLDSFSFGTTFFFAGTVLTSAPDSFVTTFWAQGHKPMFAESHALTFVVDGETLDCGQARYARKSGDRREFLNFVIPRAYLEKIVRGRDVQLKMGSAQFKLRPEHLKLFSDLLAVSNPA